MISARRFGTVYVLAEMDPAGHAPLLEAVDKAMTTVIQPVIDADAKRRQVCAAPDDPNADCCQAMFSKLNQAPINICWEEIKQIMLRNEPN